MLFFLTQLFVAGVGCVHLDFAKATQNLGRKENSISRPAVLHNQHQDAN